jgi:hypothetical protein
MNSSTTWPVDWADVPPGNKQAGASALWAGEQVYNYYLNTFNRKSYDGQNHEINFFINGNENGHDNAYCTPQGFGILPNILFFGDGNAVGCNGPIIALDVVGHEFTHAVNNSTANLSYYNENAGDAPALMESFCDIFGTMIEFYIFPTTADWVNADKCYTFSSGFRRSLSNPKDFGQPDYYNGENWLGTDRFSQQQLRPDHVAHVNNGVGNKWFWLLAYDGIAQGYLDDDVTKEHYAVPGLKPLDASKIAYYTLTGGFSGISHLTSYSQYTDTPLPDPIYTGAVSIRAVSVAVARHLYGDCTPNAAITALAWHAVGVNNPDGPDYYTEREETAQYSTALYFPGKSAYRIGASKSITAKDAADVPDGVNVTYVAGDQILLAPDFHAESGSIFHAYIDNTCNDVFKSNKTSHNDRNTGSSNQPSTTPNVNLKFQASPNPAGAIIHFTYSLPIDCFSQVGMFDMLGNTKSTVFSESQLKGTHTFDFNTVSFPSGMYYCRLQAGGKTETVKIIIEH